MKGHGKGTHLVQTVCLNEVRPLSVPPEERTDNVATAPENEVVTDTSARVKRPFLRRVHIRGYKSIAFCDVTLEPLTILVGRNASGKSSFLDALAFLRDLMNMRATEAVNE